MTNSHPKKKKRNRPPDLSTEDPEKYNWQAPGRSPPDWEQRWYVDCHKRAHDFFSRYAGTHDELNFQLRALAQVLEERGGIQRSQISNVLRACAASMWNGQFDACEAHDRKRIFAPQILEDLDKIAKSHLQTITMREVLVSPNRTAVRAYTKRFVFRARGRELVSAINEYLHNAAFWRKLAQEEHARVPQRDANETICESVHFLGRDNVFMAQAGLLRKLANRPENAHFAGELAQSGTRLNQAVNRETSLSVEELRARICARFTHDEFVAAFFNIESAAPQFAVRVLRVLGKSPDEAHRIVSGADRSKNSQRAAKKKAARGGGKSVLVKAASI